MRTKPFQCIFSFLALLGTVHGYVSPTAECTAQAWVRAPDLAPDTIVRGDVKVKISAGCPAVETVLLGLRLKERSVMKALLSQEDRKQMHHLNRPQMNFQPMSPWAFPPSRFSNRSDEITFQEMLANKDLWLVREEERLVFETLQVIRVAEGASGDCDVVQDFAVLIPSTNFPPALDSPTFAIFMMGGDAEMVNAEFMYEYFIRVPFSNGTTKEISAGHTSFQPPHNPADTPRKPSSETIGLESRHIGVPQKDPPITNYTAHVSDLAFTQGSEGQIVTVVITRTGPARTFTAPLTVQGCVGPTLTPKWAVEYDVASSRLLGRSGCILRSTPEDVEARRKGCKPQCFGGRNVKVSIAMPNSTLDEIQSGDIVTTTSAAVTIPIEIDRRQITNFETYYQTLANSLWITLETPRSMDETVDPDDPSAEPPFSWGPEFKDDEEPWVPWESEQTSEMPRPRSWGPYSGSVPAVVRSIGEVTPPQPGRLCIGANMSDQATLPDVTSRKQRRLIHYLDEGARGPTFVDRSAFHELLAEDPAERELHAPFLEPVISSPPEGEELIHRYYIQDRKPLIYVGETWVKKVANKDEHKVAPAMSGLGPIQVHQHV